MEDRSPLPRSMAAGGCGSRTSVDASRKARTKAGGGRGGDQVRCTGRQCRSCTGGAVADCVAICCCPCAVFNCLVLAFVKIPYLIGKRWCLGFTRKRTKKKKMKKKKRRRKGRKPADSDGDGDGATKIGNDGGGGDEDSWFEIGIEEEGSGGKYEGIGESEKVWVEVCDFDHLSFGRVSFAGIPLPTNARRES